MAHNLWFFLGDGAAAGGGAFAPEGGLDDVAQGGRKSKGVELGRLGVKIKIDANSKKSIKSRKIDESRRKFDKTFNLHSQFQRFFCY